MRKPSPFPLSLSLSLSFPFPPFSLWNGVERVLEDDRNDVSLSLSLSLCVCFMREMRDQYVGCWSIVL